MIDVCDIHVMKPLLAEHGFHFSKAKGQNFLTQRWVPENIAEKAGVDGTAGVLEIGPGIGPLTQQLCLRANKVCAVEVDERLKPDIAILQRSVNLATVKKKAAFAAAIGCKVLIPHHMDFPGITPPEVVEALGQAFLELVPDGVFITPEHGQWINL